MGTFNLFQNQLPPYNITLLQRLTSVLAQDSQYFDTFGRKTMLIHWCAVLFNIIMFLTVLITLIKIELNLIDL